VDGESLVTSAVARSQGATPRRNEKKRHHYIPITYLEKFTDEKGRVVAYRKDDVKTPLHVRPKEIAFERYYYSQPLPEGGQDNDRLEDFFSTIESTWPLLLDRLRSGSETAEDMGLLGTFMCLMRVRVPATRDTVELILAEQVKATTRLLDRQGKLPPKPEGHEDILDHMEVAIDPHRSLLAMPSLAQGFGLVLGSLKLQVLHNETGIRLLTSDNPVIYFDPTRREADMLPYQVRPPARPIELLFPIDHETVIRGTNGRPRIEHAKLTDQGRAERINRLVARFGYRFVFARDRTHAAMIAKYAKTSPVISTVNLTEPTGGSAMFFGWVFGQRPRKPKWDREARNRIAAQ
jgi:hypothetical protein